MGKFTITIKKEKTLFLPQILICLLIIVIPVTSVLNSFVGGAGWIKDFICLAMCFFAIVKWRNNILLVSICPVLYLILVVIGSMFNDNVLESIRYRCEFAITFALFFSAIKFTSKRKERIIKSIVITIYGIGLLVAIIAVIEFFNPTVVHKIYGSNLTQHISVIFGVNTSNRLVSTMANPINLGLQMAISCAAALGLFFLSDKGKVEKVFFAASCLLFIWVIAFTYSRTAYLVVATIFAGFFLLQFKNVKVQKKLLILILGFILVIFLYRFISQNTTLATRIGNINFQEFSSNTRFNRAVLAFKNSKASLLNILFGFGIGDTLGESGQYVFEFGFASLLYESGILGIMIYAGAIIKSMFSCIYIFQQKKYTMLEKNVALTFLSIILGFCTAMVTEDVYMQLPYSMYLWMSIFMIERIKIDGCFKI
nr:O-antigen ligase family protein [uncultured Sellimonas sp.]